MVGMNPIADLEGFRDCATMKARAADDAVLSLSEDGVLEVFARFKACPTSGDALLRLLK
jgi:hypothetical protein